MDDYFDKRDKVSQEKWTENEEGVENGEDLEAGLEEEEKEFKETEKENKVERPTNATATPSKGRASTKTKRNESEDQKQSKKVKTRGKSKDGNEMDLKRRFKVKISNVKVQNLQPEMLDLYLQFVIGGNFKEDYTTTPSGRRVLALGGKRGPSTKTELIRGIGKDETRIFSCHYECEYHGSYTNLKEESLEIEAWSYSRWTLNNHLGKISIPLERVANGSLTRSELIVKQSDRKALCRIYYTVFFQEIRDFSLTFSDWKISDLLTDTSKTFDLNPQIELTLLTNEINKPSVHTSETRKGERTPYWDKINGSMSFRGTIDDLESQKLQIRLFDLKALGVVSTTLIQREVPLRGIVDFGIIKTTVNIGKAKGLKKNKTKVEIESPTSPVDDHMKTENDEMLVRSTKKSQKEGALIDPNDQNLKDESLQVQIEGRINVGKVPMHRQRGEMVRLKSTSKYIAVKIQSADKIPVPETRATVNTYLTIEWAGQLKRSSIQYDNYQPIFNEEFYFEIPLKKKFLKQGADPFKQLRSELQTNNTVTIDLWLEGEDGTSDNLGSTVLTISEIENAPKESKMYFDDVTKREVRYISRTLETKKHMQTDADQAGQAQVYLEFWFLPDMPETIDLRAYSNIQEDRFPIELDYEKRKDDFEQLWNERINSNFVTAPLEPIRIKNMKKLFVDDQYKKPHFLSKFLGKFTVEEYALDEKNFKLKENIEKERQDRRIRTLGDIAHYVRCIPFKTEGRNSNVWYTPNFIPIMKKGDVIEHALLMACLFMGANKIEEEDENDNEPESDDDIEEKKHYDEKDMRYPPLENRVFVCVGVSKATKSTHYWVMTLNKRCDQIIFWETTTNEKYVLKGRIDPSEKYKLRFFLNSKTGQETRKKEENKLFGAFNKGFGLIKDLGKKVNDLNLFDETGQHNLGNPQESMKDDEAKDKSGKKDKKQKKKQKDEKNEEDEDDDDEIDKEANENGAYNIVPEKAINLDDIDMKLRNTTNLRSTFLNNLKKEVKFTITQQNESSKAKNKQAARSTFLQHEIEAEKENERGNKDIHLKAILSFVDNTGKSILSKYLPFASLELIFNHKNVWANMQFPNPNKIKFHLHNQKEWNPYFYVGPQVWKDQIGSFYTFKSMGPPSREEDLKAKKEDIIRSVNFGVTAARSGQNLQTLWKTQKDPVVKHLEEYLRLKERRDKEVFSDEVYQQEMEKWELTLKTLMPQDYRYRSLPMFFSFTEGERIKTTVVKQASQFYMTDEENCLFALACKVTPYPGQFNSVRILLSVFYPIPEEELEDEDLSQNMSGLMDNAEEEANLLDELDL